MNDTDLLNNAIRELVIANRILARENVIDGFGHVSVRHPTNPDRFLLSRSRSPEIVTRDDIMEFELDGTLVSDDLRRPYAERYIHGAIYMARPDINSVSHHHAHSVIPFSLSDTLLRPAFHMASVTGTQTPVWDSQPEFGDTNMLVDTLEMGHSLARTLGENPTALLRGHGAVCAAPNLRAICMVSIYMRDNAELILNTLPLGQPKYLSPGEIEKTAAMLLSEMPLARAWDYWIARAGFQGL
ncbi:MAG: aldolase [Phyllobacteriaceae bacterium]|nr:aldolase [Phyllobacteriaceae bacterium]MBA92760.1 aldolase [Phyllobacteriaceae bacterium]